MTCEAGSFQSHPPEQDSKSSGTKKKTGKKSTALASSGNDTSEQLEIRFVMADKDGLQQEKDKARNPTPATTTGAHTATGPGLKTGPTGSISTSNSNSTPQTSDPSHCTSEELTMIDQDTAGSSPVPDFEKNADGKYRCSWPRCGKEFTVASRLTTHFRIHSGKPPYLCGYKDCQKAFHTSSSLSHHRVVHTDQGLRPYVCRHNRCGATYTQLARLITHQRTTHSGMILFIPQESPSSSTTIPATSSSSSSSSSSSASSSVPNPNPSTASLPGTIPNTATVAGANPTNGASDPATATEGMPTQARPTPASPARKEQTSSAKPKNDGGSSPPITHPTPPQQTNSTPPTAQTSAAYAKEPSPFQHQRPGQTTAGVSAMTSENPNGPLTPSLSKHREGHESVNHLDNGNRGGKENGEEEESEEMRQKKEAALAMTSLHEVTLHSRPSTAFDAPPSAAAATGTSQYRPHPPPPQPLPSSATSAQPEPPSHDSSLPSRYPPYDYHPQLPAPPAPPGQHSYHTDYLAENSNSRYHRHGPPPPVILPGTAPQQSPHPPPPAGPPPPYPARPSAGYWDSGAERDKHVQEYGWEPDRDRHYPSSMPTPSQTQTQSQRPFMNEGRYFGSDPPTNGPPHAPLHHTKPLQGQNSGSHNPYHGYD
ncbi:hypothetical protein BGW38_000041 [Lunasporangiospora selenospora]|uniref:C2H2-type domain-containing protein n=1 Tax=Lunasporangiospora selenospora TaxID=979761 RepID=A0A9P6FXM8_9FUNG|nr:hypothetical protein BGW38_000041 [Lunasporangiospora selenospora]